MAHTKHQRLDERQDEIYAMVDAGMSYTDVADILDLEGIDKYDLSKYMRSTELARKRKKFEDNPSTSCIIPNSVQRREIHPLIWYGYYPDNPESRLTALRDFVRGWIRLNNGAELARRTGISEAMVNTFAAGKANMSAKKLEKCYAEIAKIPARIGEMGRPVLCDEWCDAVCAYVGKCGCWRTLARRIDMPVATLWSACVDRTLHTMPRDRYHHIDAMMRDEEPIPGRKPAMDAIQIDFAQNLRRMGKTIKETASLVGATRSTMTNCLKMLRKEK